MSGKWESRYKVRPRTRTGLDFDEQFQDTFVYSTRVESHYKSRLDLPHVVQGLLSTHQGHRDTLTGGSPLPTLTSYIDGSGGARTSGEERDDLPDASKCLLASLIKLNPRKKPIIPHPTPTTSLAKNNVRPRAMNTNKSKNG